MLAKILILFFLVLFLYILVFFTAAVIPFLSDMKMNFTGQDLFEFTKDLFLNPISNAQLLIEDRNPIFIIGMPAATILIIYMIFKFYSKKDYENVSDRYGVQGTSRFALNKEIFKKNEIEGLNKNKLNQIILNSMSQKIGDD